MGYWCKYLGGLNSEVVAKCSSTLSTMGKHATTIYIRGTLLRKTVVKVYMFVCVYD